MKIYLSGPMRGITDFNFPAFDEAAARLRAVGHDVFSPADHDREIIAGTKRTVEDLTVRECMRADCAYICDEAEAIFVLPGWELSRGARAEVALAEALGLPIHDAETGARLPQFPLPYLERVHVLPVPRLPRDPELVPPRVKVLEEAIRLTTGDRNRSYGSPTQNFQNTADVWTVQFAHLLRDGVRFTASHVAQAMVGLKLVRMIAGAKRDNWVDIAGYAGCGAECDEEAS